MNHIRLLIVEDNHDIAENIAEYLELHGYMLDFAYDGVSGLHLALTEDFDGIVLDIMLPALDGLSFCRKLRNEGRKQTPVLMLTARDALSDKLEGFDAGADDYLIKPFAMQELEARLSALLRRSKKSAPAPYRLADLKLDPDRMKATRSGHTIELNRTCWKILTTLMEAYPNVVHRVRLEKILWGDMPPGSDALRSHIYALRRAIDRPFNTQLIQTVHGIGYRLVDPNEISSQSS